MIQLGNFNVIWNNFYDEFGRRITIAQIFDSEKRLIRTGRSTCSEKDLFSKEKGRKQALAKALTKSNISKQERFRIWEDYRTNMTKTPRWESNNNLKRRMAVQNIKI